MRLSRSVVALVASTLAVPAILFAAYAQKSSTDSVAKPGERWSPERLHDWVVEEFQCEPDVAAVIRDVIGTYAELYDAWKEAKGADDPGVKAVEDRRDRLMAKYFALWDGRRDAIRRRAPAQAEKSEDANPLVLEARIQGQFKADALVSGLDQAVVAVDQDIERLEAARRERDDPAFKAALDLRAELAAKYKALWDERYDELRRHLIANDKDGAPADIESKVAGEFQRDPDLWPLYSQLQAADREVLEAMKAGRGRPDAGLAALEKRRAEASAKYDAAWRSRYDEFRRRIVAGADVFGSHKIDVDAVFTRAPQVAALREQMSATDIEIGRLSAVIPNQRDDAKRKELEQHRAALTAKHGALWQERYPALYKQAVAELQAKFTPRPEEKASEVVADRDRNSPKLRSPMTKMAMAPGGAEPYLFTPVPESPAVRVSGVARDERGAPVVNAEVTLHGVSNGGAKPVVTTTTDAEGRYEFQGVRLPTLMSLHANFHFERMPRLRFLVSGQAAGMGIAWGERWSMWQYNPQNLEVNGAEGHLFLQSAVDVDLKFARAAVLQGKVVDDKGEPIAGARVRVASYCEINDNGHEASGHNMDWNLLPEGLGHCRADGDGRFRIEGLTEHVCYSLVVAPPESPRTEFSLYATTFDGPNQKHGQTFDGHTLRGEHEALTSPITINLPELRPIEIQVVAEDDGQPVAGAHVTLRGGSTAFDYTATGETDGAGKLRLGAPPAKLGYLTSKPPADSRFLESTLPSVQVEPGEGILPIKVSQDVGAELNIEAVEAGTGKPIPDVFFWWTAQEPIAEERTSDDVSSVMQTAWTNEKGVLHATVAPAPGRRYRFHFGGMREPITSSFDPGQPRTYGYAADPARSEPVELVPGKPIHLRFELRKGPPDPNPQLRPLPAPLPARNRVVPPRLS